MGRKKITTNGEKTTAHAPTVRLKARRCTRCGSTDFKTYGSRLTQAGVRIQHCTCRACGAKIVFVFE